MDNIKQVIAKNITELRKAAGMTQTDLALKLNYTDKAVSKWERAESIPDVVVLKQIADLFHVTLDYLVEEEHKTKEKENLMRWINHNHVFITAICIMLVWLIATLLFVILGPVVGYQHVWMCFIYAIPVSGIVWLVLNSIWFAPKRNFVIISCLMWSVLLSIYLSLVTFMPGGFEFWQMFFLGIPGQLIIIFWSRLIPKSWKKTK